ncbi:hypothetical protein MLD38_013076 [Melastoma candidum]|uniref:Uncharacterized protein n=1 Tax=Melastoma candidum TaxID=119954 RepID=A0ACB9RGU7_9MYRT|nr:hypothetical protein MLD38_013076 [Melastoma candidum]
MLVNLPRSRNVQSRFSQQELPAFKPILTPGWVINAFIRIGVVFIPFGVASLFASQQVVEILDRYDLVSIPSSVSENPVNYIQDSQYEQDLRTKFGCSKANESSHLCLLPADQFLSEPSEVR